MPCITPAVTPSQAAMLCVLAVVVLYWQPIRRVLATFHGPVTFVLLVCAGLLLGETSLFASPMTACVDWVSSNYDWVHAACGDGWCFCVWFFTGCDCAYIP